MGCGQGRASEQHRAATVTGVLASPSAAQIPTYAAGVHCPPEVTCRSIIKASISEGSGNQLLGRGRGEHNIRLQHATHDYLCHQYQSYHVLWSWPDIGSGGNVKIQQRECCHQRRAPVRTTHFAFLVDERLPFTSSGADADWAKSATSDI